MIITLNSTNQNNYQFRNYFNETLSLKAGSIVTVKNIQINKDFWFEVVEGSNQFQMAFDHSAHGPYTFTIAAGRYGINELADAMNSAYNQVTFGYDIRWTITSQNDKDSQGKMNWEVNGYATPPAIPFIPIDPYNPTYITAVNTQVVALEISKTSAVAGLDNNSFLYKSYISNKANKQRNHPAGWPNAPANTTYGKFTFGVDGVVTANSVVSFGLVPHDWNGTRIDCGNRGLLIDIVGEYRRFHIVEKGNVLVDNTQSQALRAGQGLNSPTDTLLIRQYNGVANQTLNQGQRNCYGGFLIAVVTGGGAVNYCNQYRNRNVTSGDQAMSRLALNENSLFYPVWFFNDQSVNVINVEGSLVSTNINETNHNISNSVITQDFVNTDKTTVSAVVDSVQTITSDQTLSGNNVCSAHSTTTFPQGHIIFSLHSVSKEYFVGFATNSSVVSPSLILYGYKFSGGNVYVIDDGAISGDVTTTFTSNDLFKISLTGLGFPLLEKKTGGSGDYVIVDIPLDVGLFHFTDVYCVVGFPDQINSADTFVKIYEESLVSMYGLGAGSYVSFSPYTLGNSLGYLLDKYEYDSTATNPVPFPFIVTAEDPILFKGTDTQSYRVQCPNLPIKSYNGNLGASDKTMATMDIDNMGDVRFPIEQRVECLNGADIPINEIEVEITDEENALALYDFRDECQITLQIEPHLNP